MASGPSPELVETLTIPRARDLGGFEVRRTLLGEAAGRLKLTARGYHRVLRVARTLADMEGQDAVRRLHVAEALSYRRIVLA